MLTQVIGIELSNIRREQAAGGFRVDILAEDAGGRAVIIENQLQQSDHDHLGKLITYTAMLEAKVAVWIVSSPRPEHIKAVGWLNESRRCEFYLIKLEAVRIGASEPAPLLTLIMGPSDDQISDDPVTITQNGRDDERLQFWTDLLEKSKSRTKLFSTISPGRYSWIGTGSGRAGVVYMYTIKQHTTAVELYIDTADAAENESIFRRLHQQHDEIEGLFGVPLSWEALEGKRACRIRHPIDIGGYRTPESRQEVQEAMIEAMIKLEAALHPRLAQF